MNKSRIAIIVAVIAVVVITAVIGIAIRPTVVVSPLSPLLPQTAKTPMPQPTPNQPSNLLTNPNFTWPYHSSGGKDNMRVAWGWEAMWKEHPPCRPMKPGCSLPCPSNCVESSNSDVIFYDVQAEGNAVTVTLSLSDAAGIVSIDAIGSFSYTQMHLEGYVEGVTGTMYYTSPYSTYASIGKFYWHSSRQLVRDEWYEPMQELGITGTFTFLTLTFSRLEWYTPSLDVAYFLGNHAGGQVDAGHIAATVERCSSDEGCYWASPECAPINYVQAPYRAYAGETAQKCFVYGRMGEWDLYSQAEVTPGVTLLLGAYLEGWQCYDQETCCGNRPQCVSDTPATMGFRIGIDPGGKKDPDAPSVVWSNTGDSFDRFGLFTVATTAVSSTVTVFIHAAPRWDWARISNDEYIGWVYLVELPRRFYLPLVP